jgi:DNA repair protein RAD50
VDTQALEQFRKIRTEKTQAVREMKLKLETRRTHKDTAARLSADVAAGKAKVRQHTDTIEALKAQIEVRLW